MILSDHLFAIKHSNSISLDMILPVIFFFLQNCDCEIDRLYAARRLGCIVLWQ